MNSNSGISITENLTSDTLQLLKSARTLGEQNVFTDQCKIFTLQNGKRIHIKNELTITDLLKNIGTATISVDSHVPIDDSANTNIPPATAINSNQHSAKYGTKSRENTTRNDTHEHSVKSSGNRYAYGVNFSQRSDWPALLQTIDHQTQLKGRMPHLAYQDRNFYSNNYYTYDSNYNPYWDDPAINNKGGHFWRGMPHSRNYFNYNKRVRGRENYG